MLDNSSMMVIGTGMYFYSNVIEYRQTSNISPTLGSKIVDHSDVVGASPVGAAPTTFSSST